MKLLMARRFLTDVQILDVENLVNEFGTIFPTYYPERNITRKIHTRKYITLGMLSEQEGDSKHAAVNAELHALACVCNHADRIRLVLEREELRSHMNKDLLKPVSRICSVSTKNIYTIWT